MLRSTATYGRGRGEILQGFGAATERIGLSAGSLLCACALMAPRGAWADVGWSGLSTDGAVPAGFMEETDARIERVASELGLTGRGVARAHCRFPSEGNAACFFEVEVAGVREFREASLSVSDAHEFADSAALIVSDIWMVAASADVPVEPIVHREPSPFGFALSAGPSVEFGLGEGALLAGGSGAARLTYGKHFGVSLVADVAAGSASGNVETVRFVRSFVGPRLEVILPAGPIEMALGAGGGLQLLTGRATRALELNRFATVAGTAGLRLSLVLGRGVALELSSDVVMPARRRAVARGQEALVEFESVRVLSSLRVGYVF